MSEPPVAPVPDAKGPVHDVHVLAVEGALRAISVDDVPPNLRCLGCGRLVAVTEGCRQHADGLRVHVVLLQTVAGSDGAVGRRVAR